MLSHSSWFPISVDATMRYRSNRRQRPNRNANKTPLMLSSSSQIARGAIPRYTRRVRYIIDRFSLLHRLGIFAIFISVVFTFLFAIVSHTRVPYDRFMTYNFPHNSTTHQPHVHVTHRLNPSPSSNLATPSRSILRARRLENGEKPVMTSPTPSSKPATHNSAHNSEPNAVAGAPKQPPYPTKNPSDPSHHFKQPPYPTKNPSDPSYPFKQPPYPTKNPSDPSYHFKQPLYPSKNPSDPSYHFKPPPYPTKNPSDPSYHFKQPPYPTKNPSDPSYHVEDELVKVETAIDTLPHTTWYYEKGIHQFRPRREHASSIRLISLNNACYCTQRNKFVLPRAHRRSHRKSGNTFPSFVFRYGAAQAVSWTSPKRLLAFPSQKMVHILGTTILWRGRTLHRAHAHLHRSLVPIRSLIDILQKTSFHPDINLVAESFTPPDGDKQVLKLHNYYFGDIPSKNILELSRLRPRLVCFRRVIALGSEYEDHANSIQTYDHVKDLILAEEKHILKKPLVKSCTSPRANLNTIWIMSQQLGTTSFGTIENVEEVETTVNHELIKLGLADKLSLHVIQSPNVKCPPGTAREGCYDLNCSYTSLNRDDDGCERTKSPLREVQAFNNMTFLITASGPANEAFSYMPRGSQIIEVAPYGIMDHSYQQAAGDAHLMYSRVENKERKSVEQELYDRFGDVALSASACWQDFECRAARMSTKTHVNVHHLRVVLKRALFVWKAACANEPL